MVALPRLRQFFINISGATITSALDALKWGSGKRMSGQQHLMRFRFAPWNGGQHQCNKDIEVGRELRGQMEEAVFQILYDSLAFAELR
jgi:hypothetical protein